MRCSQELQKEQAKRPAPLTEADELVIVGGFKPAVPAATEQEKLQQSLHSTPGVAASVQDIKFGASLQLPTSGEDASSKSKLLQQYQSEPVDVANNLLEYDGSMIPDAATIAKV